MSARAPVIHVVDDDDSFRTAISRVLEASGYEVALYHSGDQLLESPPANGPGCILLDINMSGLNGLELQERLSRLDSMLPVVFVTGHGDIPTSVQAIRAGAEDFLTKPVPKMLLLAAIDRALRRYAGRAEQHDRIAQLRSLVATLTSRENQVFALVVRGNPNKLIAHELGIAERTVKAHRRSIMQKLKVRSVAEAVSIAERLKVSAADRGGGERMPE